MALNFIKKVFSFGRKQVEEVPADASVPDAPEHEAPVADIASAADAEVAAPESSPMPPSGEESVVAEPQAEPAPEPPPAPEKEHLPHDGGMQFTPETADDAALSPAEPADTEHAGEPPIEPVKTPEIPDTGTAQQPEPAPAPSAEEVATAETFGTAGANARQTAEAVSPPVATPVLDTGEEMVDGPPDKEPEEKQDEDTTGGNEAIDSAPVSPLDRQVRVGRSVSETQEPAAEAPATPDADRPGWWHRLRQGLARSSAQLSGQVTGIFTRRKLDEDTLQELEDVLIQADLGVETAMRITDTLASGRYGRDISTDEVSRVMAGEIEKVLAPVAKPLELDLSHKPHIILVVGVNGTGKTTTIGKLAAKLAGGGLKVMLAAGDTFRAAAIEQLKIWGERTGADVISTKLGADAAGLAYEAIEAARQKGSDVLIIDTAGRLQNRTELMDELAKVVRVIGKLDPEAPHTVLQTLDATTGQNALNQVEIFRNVAGVNGLVMTKLDGTARGGILVAIAAKHKLPVYFIGVGEGVDDLEPFEAHDFATAIAGEAQ